MTKNTVTGNTLATWRKSKLLTQQQLATKIGMSIGTVRRWEQDKTAVITGITLDNIMKWAHKSGINTEAKTTTVAPKTRKRILLQSKVATKTKAKPPMFAFNTKKRNTMSDKDYAAI